MYLYILFHLHLFKTNTNNLQFTYSNYFIKQSLKISHLKTENILLKYFITCIFTHLFKKDTNNLLKLF